MIWSLWGSRKAALGLYLGLQVPQGLLELAAALPESFALLPQVFILEMLVEKIFDLAFMPAMNGKSGCPCFSGASMLFWCSKPLFLLSHPTLFLLFDSDILKSSKHPQQSHIGGPHAPFYFFTQQIFLLVSGTRDTVPKELTWASVTGIETESMCSTFSGDRRREWGRNSNCPELLAKV